MIFEEKPLSSEQIYTGKVLNLRKDRVIARSGESWREIVEHKGGSCILPIDANGDAILVRQYRKAAEQVLLEAPAGKREGKESGLDVAIRELREETGYRASRMIHLGDIYTTPGYSEECLSLYLAMDLEPGQTDFDENEAIDIVRLPWNRLIEMARQGEIKDGKTLAALFLAEGYCKGKAEE